MTEGKVNSPVNVVIMGSIFIGWGGGLDLLRNVLNALSIKNEDFPTNLYLVLPDNSFLALVRRCVSFAWYLTKCLLNHQRPTLSFEPALNHSAVFDSLRNIKGEFKTIYYNGTQYSLKRALRKVNASVLMFCTYAPSKSFPFPWVGYIADFQHKYYPEFFSQQEISSRDIYFEHTVNLSTTLIVNSQAVKSDIERFYPDHRTAIFVLPFTPIPIRSWFDPPQEGILDKYGLPKQYFVISNQFWVHKDHKTAFEALAVLHKKTGKKDIKIVCTGKMEDFRFPDYISDLKMKIAQLDLNESIIFLGYIPKLDQVQIMKNSIAVIQPTLFEGGPGGGAIYDSVALGIPSIVSDIPVNLEAHDHSVHLFRVGDSLDLADKMMMIASQEKRYPTFDTQFAASRVRFEKYVDTIINSIKHALQR